MEDKEKEVGSEEIKDETQIEENKTETKKEKKVSKEDKLKEQIAKLERELKEEKDKNLREIAEMQTTKRRLKEAEIENRKYASMNVISELINPIDMLVAVLNSEAPSDEIRNYQMGFQMIANQLVSVLEKEGLKVMEIKENDEFNPKIMEALLTEEADVEISTVTKIRQKGYYYKDRVLKPALVEVAIPKKNIEEESKEGEE